MIPLAAHLLFWSSFFLIGLIFGFYLGYGLIPSNRNRRL